MTTHIARERCGGRLGLGATRIQCVEGFFGSRFRREFEARESGSFGPQNATNATVPAYEISRLGNFVSYSHDGFISCICTVSLPFREFNEQD